MSDTQLTQADVPVPARPRQESERVSLVIYEEPDTSAASTRVLDLAQGAQLSIGRSRTADVQIEAERVSRIHAVFSRASTGLTVADSGSRNGTWVNGEQITEPRRLASGDEVIVGSVLVVVNITSGVASGPRLEGMRYLEERLAAEVDRGLHYHRRCSLAFVQLEGAQDVTDDATERLCGALRPMEAIAEYAPGVLALVMPELDAAQADHNVRELVATARGDASPAALKFFVGVAAFPDHSTTVGGLLSRARAALASVHRHADDLVHAPPSEPDVAPSEVVVVDPQMVRVYELAKKVAEHTITVLVRGETGSGKEMVASSVHTASKRRGRLVGVNCASLSETLLESELFGHEKGAFTGADKRKQGFFEAANGGTLFLDEIGEMTPALQAKLLRVLETRKVMRVGGTEEIPVDVRVVCATHRDLEAESKRGNFRADLFFRISSFTILIPPLRDRTSEIEPLARAFIEQASTAQRRRIPTLSPEAMLALRRYPWPGNVRELRNAIERAMILHTGTTIRLEDLPDSIRDARTTSVGPAMLAHQSEHQDVNTRIAELERIAISTALEAAGGNQTEAAKQLGISRRTLIYRMEKHGLKPLPESRK